MDYTLILPVLLYVVLFANVAAAIAILFFERRDVSATWAWLMILFFLPVIGFLIYLLFGRSLKQETFYHVPEARRIGARRRAFGCKRTTMFPAKHRFTRTGS